MAYRSENTAPAQAVLNPVLIKKGDDLFCHLQDGHLVLSCPFIVQNGYIKP